MANQKSARQTSARQTSARQTSANQTSANQTSANKKYFQRELNQFLYLAIMRKKEIIYHYNIGEMSNSNDMRPEFKQGNTAQIIRNNVSINITILGGCSGLNDMKVLERNIGICGCGAGSLYTFVGKNNAVLLNYNKPII